MQHINNNRKNSKLDNPFRLGAVLYVFKGEYGLPSIDFDCLRALCLVKFTRCPVEIDTNGNPLRSGAGKLPYLQIGNQKYASYRRIKKVLDKEGFPIDQHLRNEAKHLSPSWANWVFTNLHSYYQYFMYGEPNNFDTTTRSLYAKRTPFPFNFYYPGTYQKEACDIVNTFNNFSIYDKLEMHETDYLVLNAKKCVNILSRKLGNKVWFFGDVFSELDAIVYSYLAIIFKVTLSNNPLQSHIKASQNLVNFINRITRDIFKNEAFNSLKTSGKSSSGSTFTGSDILLTETERNFIESERKTKILAGFGAVAAITAFAMWRGLHYQLPAFKKNYTYRGVGYDEDEYYDEDGQDD